MFGEGDNVYIAISQYPYLQATFDRCIDISSAEPEYFRSTDAVYLAADLEIERQYDNKICEVCLAAPKNKDHLLMLV